MDLDRYKEVSVYCRRAGTDIYIKRYPKTGKVSEIDCPHYQPLGNVRCNSFLGILDFLNCPPAERIFKEVKKDESLTQQSI